jgi:hypothetical protein
MTGPSPKLLGLACEIADGVNALAPRHWRSARIRCEFAEGQPVRVLGIDARLDTRPPDKPEAGLDLQGRLGGLAAALTELGALVEEQGVRWAGGVKLARTEAGGVALTLEGAQGARPAGSVALSAEAVGGLFLDEPFWAALEQAAPKLIAAEQAVAERLRGLVSSSFDPKQGTLSWDLGAGGRVEAPAQLLGTWTTADEQWLWAWANTAVEPACTELIERAVAPERRAPGLTLLWRERYGCELGLATKVAQLAAHRAGAVGVFVGRGGQTVSFFALMA